MERYFIFRNVLIMELLVLYHPTDCQLYTMGNVITLLLMVAYLVMLTWKKTSAHFLDILMYVYLNGYNVTMKDRDMNFLEPIENVLPWRTNKKMPIAKERIVVLFTDDYMDVDYAINFCLFWGCVKKWTYVKDVTIKRYLVR